MTKKEIEMWQAVTKSSQFHWTEDDIFRLNGHGAFYYHGGEDGIYLKIRNDGMLEAGSYEGAIPHIGEAFFNTTIQHQCKDYNEAYKMAMETGGKQFLIDMLTPVETDFYCPLVVYSEHPYGNDCSEIDNEILVDYEAIVREAIFKEVEHGSNEDMAEYFHGNTALQEKLLSVQWDIENVNREVYGCIHVKTNDPMTAEEKQELGKWITGQNSDGWGECFEQRPIDTPDGEIYISFWNSDSYFLMDRDEFNEMINGSFVDEELNKNVKHDCPLIGQDGNIFNLIGIAARTTSSITITMGGTAMPIKNGQRIYIFSVRQNGS